MCAKLAAPTGGSGLQITENAPPGQYVAVCLRVNDLFGVERQKFQSQEMETRDVTRFVFGLKDQQGKKFLLQTYEFTISGAPGANLIKFLTSWLGQNPQMGWDYAEMLGKGAMVTIQHKPSAKNPGQSYANITGISPVFAQLAHLVPQGAEFEPMLASLESKAAQPGQQQAPAQSRPPGAGYPQPNYTPPTQQPAPGYGYPAQTPPPPPPAPPAPPPPPAAPPRQLSPDGKWELVNNQWVPAQQSAPPPPPTVPGFPPGTQFAPGFGAGQPAPGGFVPPASGPDEDVPF
jgi:hypothetical protein